MDFICEDKPDHDEVVLNGSPLFMLMQLIASFSSVFILFKICSQIHFVNMAI